jgi:hypothetical protein
MRWSILALFLLSACAREPTDAERISRTMSACAAFKDNAAAAACYQGLADGIRELRQFDRDTAQQEALDGLTDQIRQQQQQIEALRLQPWER